MPVSNAAVGTQFAPVTLQLSADDAARFATAVGDDPRQYTTSGIAPPLFAAKVGHAVLQRVLDDPDFGLHDTRLLHAEQDMSFARPLRTGIDATVAATVVEVAPYGLGIGCVLAVVIEQDDVVASVSTTTLLVPADGPVKGERRRRAPGPARREEVGSVVIPVGLDAPAQYAAASGDRNPIHLDPEAARAAGLPGVILHGMCTLAMAANAAVAVLADGDPRALRSVQARFSRPVVPGDSLDCRFFATDQPTRFVMTVAVDRKAVLRDAAVDVGPPAYS